MNAIIIAAAVLLAAQDPQAENRKLRADLEVVVRQLEVQRVQAQEMAAKLEEYRKKLGETGKEKGYTSAELARSAKDLADLEEKHIALARERSRLQDPLIARKTIQAKVTAVTNDLGLVIISVGREEGVLEGHEFTVYRGESFVAKVVINKVDAKWSAGRVLLKKEDPRVADDVTNNVLTGREGDSAPGWFGPLSRVEAENLRDIRRELDDVRRQVRELTDKLTPSWTDHGVAVDVLSDELRGHFAIDGGLIVRRVREGSAAEKAGLKPFDILPGITEAQLLEGLAKGAAPKIVRAGRAR